MKLQDGKDILGERGRRRINQADVAKMLGIKIHTLVDIENGAPFILSRTGRQKLREYFREHDAAAGATI